MKINKKYLPLFSLLIISFILYSGKATESASLDELPIKNERPHVANILTLEEAKSEIDERVQDESYQYFYPIFIIRTQATMESVDTEKTFWQILAEPVITNWLMVLVTLAYLIATIFISNANRKSSDAAQRQLEESRLQQRQNVGIQLYDRRKELMISISNNEWAADSNVVREDIIFMFDLNCARMYESCCNMKKSYLIYANTILDYMKRFNQQLPTKMIHIMPQIAEYEERLSKEPMCLKNIDLCGLYQFTDDFYLEIPSDISNLHSDLDAHPVKRNLRELNEEANRLLVNQCDVQILLIEEMQTIIKNSITIDPKGTLI